MKSFDAGAAVIREYLRSLPDTPGVYRMLGEGDEVLYVGKARALKKRVLSYTGFSRLSVRIQRMVALTRKMEFAHTHTEAEALLLESNLIKKLKPRFNILLRDDKSFPYIVITGDHDFPLVTKHRGAKKRKGEYYGPFASAGDVNRALDILQRLFLLRNCSDNMFASRTRPCLQYHIKRCTAPCVSLVTKEQYAAQVKQAQDFLEGKSRAVQDAMTKAMHAASADTDYETAALYRDRIKALTSLQSRQDIHMEGLGNADVIVLTQNEKTGGMQGCVQVFFFRSGANYGNRAYFPRHHEDDAPGDILAAFMAQFYENKPVPREIIVSHDMQDHALLEEALSSKAGVAVKITRPTRGKRGKLVSFALRNAQAALEIHKAGQASEEKLLRGAAELLGLDEPPGRIEVYDNSHISGTYMVGAMIVAGPEGLRKNAYRKFNIKQAAAADDTGMMREVLGRRFKSALKENPQMSGEGWPDIVMVDGGRGQFNAARAVLEECGVWGTLLLVAIAKGEDRNAGRETFIIDGRPPFQLPVNDKVLHYLQRLRDEAHRFAIGTHRARRTKAISESPLDEIPGIGAARKKALLLHFGSAKAVAQAGVEDLHKVEGVSKAKAQTIYDHFH